MALWTIRAEFRLDCAILDDHIQLGVKCKVDTGIAQFLVISSKLEWSAISGEMKHIQVDVQKPGRAGKGDKISFYHAFDH